MSWRRGVEYWTFVAPSVIFGSLVIAYAMFLFGGSAAEAASLNFWGDAEALILPTWIAAGVLMVTGFGVAEWVRRRRDRSST